VAIENDLLDKLLADHKKLEDIIGENGLRKQLTKALVERAMSAELSQHPGFAKHDPATSKGMQTLKFTLRPTYSSTNENTLANN
jgi:putative transposase